MQEIVVFLISGVVVAFGVGGGDEVGVSIGGEVGFTAGGVGVGGVTNGGVGLTDETFGATSVCVSFTEKI